MPTIEEYASDPDDFDLPLEAPTPADKGKGPALPSPADFPLGAEPTIPKALRIGYDGSLRPVEPAEFAGCVLLSFFSFFFDAHLAFFTAGRPSTPSTSTLSDLSRTAEGGSTRRRRWSGLRRNRLRRRRGCWVSKRFSRFVPSLLSLDREGTLTYRLIQPSKTHPKDWENPGRIKVQMKDEDGKLKNASIKNSASLSILPLSNRSSPLPQQRPSSSAGSATSSALTNRKHPQRPPQTRTLSHQSISDFLPIPPQSLTAPSKTPSKVVDRSAPSVGCSEEEETTTLRSRTEMRSKRARLRWSMRNRKSSRRRWRRS